MRSCRSKENSTSIDGRLGLSKGSFRQACFVWAVRWCQAFSLLGSSSFCSRCAICRSPPDLYSHSDELVGIEARCRILRLLIHEGARSCDPFLRVDFANRRCPPDRPSNWLEMRPASNGQCYANGCHLPIRGDRINIANEE